MSSFHNGPQNLADLRSNVPHSEEGRRLILLHAYKIGASMVQLKPGEPVLYRIDGILHRGTQFALQLRDVELMAVGMSGDPAVVSRLSAQQQFDLAINVEDDEIDEDGERRRYRFRINMTGIYYEGSQGIDIVSRPIPAIPPTCEQILLEDEIIRESTPRTGGVVAAGTTGSGKTTTFAALMRRVAEDPASPYSGNVISYEEPIEYTFDMLKSSRVSIGQSQIGLHVKSFQDGVRAAMRREPVLVLIGEMRDFETVNAACMLAATGHPFYSTVHADNVGEIIRRMTLLFPADGQEPAFHLILANMHLLLAQTLVPKIGGGRVCLREWQVLRDRHREEIMVGGMLQSRQTMRKIMERGDQGQSMIKTVEQRLDANLITLETARNVLLQFQYDDAARTLG